MYMRPTLVALLYSVCQQPETISKDHAFKRKERELGSL